MPVIASKNGFSISSTFGTSILEGSLGSSEGNGASIGFSIVQSKQSFRTVFVEVVPVSGQAGDFWDTFWSNKIGGEPADQFALSGFYSLNVGSEFRVNLNADSLDEGDEAFVIRVHESHMDAAYGYAPLIESRFTIIDDDVNGTAKNDRLVGAAISETFRAGNGADTILGAEGNDTILAGAGDDQLIGGVGYDQLFGGAGNDIYITDGRDTIREAASGGTDTVRSSATHTLAANVENLALTGTAAVNGTGNALDNLIGGNAAANWLDGGAGRDTLAGGAGSDTYMTDGGDVIREAAGGGIDTVRSSATHSLAANVENLVLTGTSAVNGIGNVLGNVLTGNAAANVLNGWAGNDMLSGGAGNDTLMGGAGADRLVGGIGRDVLRGGAADGAADIFVFNHVLESAVAAGRDIIVEFEAGIDDIDLRGIDANQRSAGDQAFVIGGTSARANAVWTMAVDGGVVVRGDVNGDRLADFEVMLSGAKQIGAADFLL